jgi:toxin-antitoxin system PIN domain toxin
VIAVDSNLLIYAHRVDSPFHRPAEAWLRKLVEGVSPWALPWPCLHEFLGHVTNPRIYRDATALPLALEQVDRWIASPSVTLLSETEDYWPILTDIITTGQVIGGRVHDAKIAALVRAHGVSHLATCDRDFSRFAGISVFNPLHADRANEGAAPRKRRTRTA